METLTELLEEQVKDLYNAEGQLTKALPKMAKAATTGELKDAIEAHLEETMGHVKRLEEAARELEIKPSGKTCAAMKGLIEEGKEALSEGEEGPILDAAIIAAAQRVEHYEIAAYGTARALAQQIGNNRLVELFEETLNEESAADEKLTQVAEQSVYPNAQGDGEIAEEEDGDEKSESRGSSRRAAKSGGRSQSSD